MTNPTSYNDQRQAIIVDNADTNWTVKDYLREWCEVARSLDIATGYFEIGALLALDGAWQQLESIRLLMGDEVSRRTRQAFELALAQITATLDRSLEAEKQRDDFLQGVPAIVQALKDGTIQARVYRKAKFHAKGYITHTKIRVMPPLALVGSSNFTLPGLTQNVELNVQLRAEVDELQAWYERYWEQAEDVTPEILRVIERHTRDYTPFEVYARALRSFFESHEQAEGEWERTESHVYRVLDHYQREAYHQLVKISARYNGALLCDGVGLGKTFVGLMLIERLLHDRKKVALLVPKAARDDVWVNNIRRYLPTALGNYTNVHVYNHTDLLRGGDFPELMDEIRDEVDAIVIDEAHNFRNTTSQRRRKLYEMCAGKELYMLTATPINNSLYDLMHLIELFSREEPGYFQAAPLGIHTLRGHFRRMEDALQVVTGDGEGIELDARQAQAILGDDQLFRELVVQRSRAYVRESIKRHNGRGVTFPDRQPPVVAAYSLARSYGPLLKMVEAAFDQSEPLLKLGIYSPVSYLLGDEGLVDAMERGRQMQIVGLIRTLLLKRFESSAVAFRSSCEMLLLKLLYFVQLHNPKTASEWRGQHQALVARASSRQQAGASEEGATDGGEEDLEDDVYPDVIKRDIQPLNERQYNVAAMVMDALSDLEQLVRFLEELGGIDEMQDDKARVLIDLLQQDPALRQHKVLIFTEFSDTARYLERRLGAAGIGPLAEVDGGRLVDRGRIIRRFSPYYNGYSSARLRDEGLDEVRVLLSTDVLSEGLNLQDATCIINYDLHWNPVRLMQRIGRVDRRLNAEIEAQIVADHPEQAAVRGKACIWNFIPPDELNRILSLWERVTHKALRISKTFGIEGEKLLTPEDDYEALRVFNEAYEGRTTLQEELSLAYQELLHDHPGLEERLKAMPGRVFSGRAWPERLPAGQGVFFCYRLPAKEVASGEWTAEAGFTRWYWYDTASGDITADLRQCHERICCAPPEPRLVRPAPETLSEIRAKMDDHVTRDYIRKVQAPAGVTFELVAWMAVG